MTSLPQSPSVLIRSLISLQRNDPIGLTRPKIWIDLQNSFLNTTSTELHLDPTQLFNFIFETISLIIKTPSYHTHPETIISILNVLQILFSSRFESVFSPAPQTILDNLIKIYELYIDQFSTFFHLHTKSYTLIDYLQFLWDAWKYKTHQWTNTNTKQTYDLFLTKIVPLHAHLFGLLSSFIQYQSQLYSSPQLASSYSNTTKSYESVIKIENSSFINAITHEQRILHSPSDNYIQKTSSPVLSTLRSPLQKVLLSTIDSAQQSTFVSIYDRVYSHLISPSFTSSTQNPYILSYLTKIKERNQKNEKNEFSPQFENNQIEPRLTTPESLRMLLSSISFLHTSFSLVVLKFILSPETTDSLITELHHLFNNVILSGLPISHKQNVVQNFPTELPTNFFKFSQKFLRFSPPQVFSDLCPLLYVESLPSLDIALDLLAVPTVVRNGRVSELISKDMKEKDVKNGPTTKTPQNAQTFIQYATNTSKRTPAFDIINIILQAAYGTLSSKDSNEFSYQTLAEHLTLYSPSQSTPTHSNPFPLTITSSGKQQTNKTQLRPSNFLPIEFGYQFVPFWFDIILIAIRTFYAAQSHQIDTMTAQSDLGGGVSDVLSEVRDSILLVSQQLSRNLSEHLWMIESTLVLIAMKLFTSVSPINNVQCVQGALGKQFSNSFLQILNKNDITVKYNNEMVGEYYNYIESPRLSILTAQISNLEHFFTFFLAGQSIYSPSKDKSLALFTLLQSTIIHMAYSFTSTPISLDGVGDKRFLNDDLKQIGFDYLIAENEKNNTKNAKKNPKNKNTFLQLQQTYNHVLAHICTDEHFSSSNIAQDDEETQSRREKVYVESLSYSTNSTPFCYTKTPFMKQHPLISNNTSLDSEYTNQSLWSQIYSSLVSNYFNPFYSQNDQNLGKNSKFETKSEQLFQHKYSPSNRFLSPFFPSFSMIPEVINTSVIIDDIDPDGLAGLDTVIIPIKQNNNICVEFDKKRLIFLLTQKLFFSNFLTAIIPTILLSIFNLSADIATNTLSIFILLPTYLSQLSLQHRIQLASLTAVSLNQISGSETKKIIENYSIILSQKYCHFRQPQTLYRHYFSITSLLLIPQSIPIFSTKNYFLYHILPKFPINGFSISLPENDSFPQALALTTSILSQCLNSLTTLSQYQQTLLFMGMNHLITTAGKGKGDCEEKLAGESTFLNMWNDDNFDDRDQIGDYFEEKKLIIFLENFSQNDIEIALDWLSPQIRQEAFDTCQLLHTITTTLTQLSKYCVITHLDNDTFLNLLKKHDKILRKITIIENLRHFFIQKLNQNLKIVGAKDIPKKLSKRSRDDVSTPPPSPSTSLTGLTLYPDPYAMLILGSSNDIAINPSFQYIFKPYQNDEQSDEQYDDKIKENVRSVQNERKNPPKMNILTIPSLISLSLAIHQFIQRAQEPTLVPTHYVFSPTILSTILQKPHFSLFSSSKIPKMPKIPKTDNKITQIQINSYLHSISMTHLDKLAPNLTNKLMTDVMHKLITGRGLGSNDAFSILTMSSLFALQVSTPSYCERQSRLFTRYIIDYAIDNGKGDVEREEIVQSVMLQDGELFGKFLGEKSGKHDDNDKSDQCGHLVLTETFILMIDRLVDILETLIKKGDGGENDDERKNEKINKKNNQKVNALIDNSSEIDQITGLINDILIIGSPLLANFYQSSTLCPCNNNSNNKKSSKFITNIIISIQNFFSRLILLNLNPLQHFLYETLPTFEWFSLIIPGLSMNLLNSSFSHHITINNVNINHFINNAPHIDDNSPENQPKKSKKNSKIQPTPNDSPMVQLTPRNELSCEFTPNKLGPIHSVVDLLGSFTSALSDFQNSLSMSSNGINTSSSEVYGDTMSVEYISRRNAHEKDLFSKFLTLWDKYQSTKDEVIHTMNESDHYADNTDLESPLFYSISFLKNIKPFLFLQFFNQNNRNFTIYLSYILLITSDLFSTLLPLDRSVIAFKNGAQSVLFNFVTNSLPLIKSKAKCIFVPYSELYTNFVHFCSVSLNGEGVQKTKNGKKDAKKDPKKDPKCGQIINSLHEFFVNNSPVELFTQLLQTGLKNTQLNTEMMFSSSLLVNFENLNKNDNFSQNSSQNFNLIPMLLNRIISTHSLKSAELLDMFVNVLIPMLRNTIQTKKKAIVTAEMMKQIDEILPKLILTICNYLEKTRNIIQEQNDGENDDENDGENDDENDDENGEKIQNIQNIQMYNLYLKSLTQLYSFIIELPVTTNLNLQLQTDMAEQLANPIVFELIAIIISSGKYDLFIDIITTIQKIACLYQIRPNIPEHLIGKNEEYLFYVPIFKHFDNFEQINDKNNNNNKNNSQNMLTASKYPLLPTSLRFLVFLFHIHHIIMKFTPSYEQLNNFDQNKNEIQNEKIREQSDQSDQNITKTINSPENALNTLEMLILDTINHSLSTPQPVFAQNDTNNISIVVLGSNTIAQILLQMCNQLFNISTPINELIFEIQQISISLFKNQNFQPNCVERITQLCTNQDTFPQNGLIVTLITYVSNIIMKGLVLAANEHSTLISFEPIFATKIDFSRTTNNSTFPSPQTRGDNNSDSDDDNPLSHILRINQQNTTNNASFVPNFDSKFKQISSFFQQLLTPLSNQTFQNRNSTGSKNRFATIYNQNMINYLHTASKHLSLLLSLIPTSDSGIDISTVNMTALFGVKYSICVILETLAVFTKPPQQQSQKYLQFQFLSIITHMLTLFNPFFVQVYNDVPVTTGTHRNRKIVNIGEDNNQNDQNNTPYKTTLTTITLDILFTLYPIYTTILTRLPVHITASSNNTNPSRLSHQFQQLTIFYATQLLSPALTFIFSISHYLHDVVNVYFTQLSRLYTPQDRILISAQSHYNNHIEQLSSCTHNLTKVFINITHQQNKKMIPYLLVPLFNTFLTQYSLYSSQIVISLTQSISFTLSVMLATIQVPEHTGSLYVFKQREKDDLGDIDFVVTDLNVLTQYLDPVGKAALTQLIRVATGFRYYR